MRVLLQLATFATVVALAACAAAPIRNVSNAPVTTALGWIENLTRGINAQLSAS